jgi:hypothetical protein
MTYNQHIQELCNQLVAAVEQDVKTRIYTSLSVQTGMHGEPLPVTSPMPKTREQRGKDKELWRQGSKLHRLFRTIATRKHGLNIKSLARKSGMTEQSVHQAIKKLRGNGYNIVCQRVGLQRPKYKLAS